MSFNPFLLTDKRILIVGASSGIGREASVCCSRLGAEVLISARNQQNLEKTWELMEKTRDNLIIPCDINIRDDVQSLIQSLNGKLDGVVFCAGTLKTIPIKLMDIESLNAMLSTNFTSQVNLVSELVKNKKINSKASLVFISSLAAHMAEGGNSIYSASKAALSAFSRGLALELATRKIRVNTVSPGMVRTPFLENFSVDQEQLDEDEKRYPLGYGQPQDVANAVAYLLSDAARWVTGTDLIIDGGRRLK